MTDELFAFYAGAFIAAPVAFGLGWATRKPLGRVLGRAAVAWWRWWKTWAKE